MKHLFSLVIAIMAAASIAFAATPQKAVFTVTPRMSCQNCENKIKQNLRFEKGVKHIDTSLSEQTVTITFDPEKTDTTRIRKGFARIGYKAAVAAPKQSANPETSAPAGKK